MTMTSPMVKMALTKAEGHYAKLQEAAKKAKAGESVTADLDALVKEFSVSLEMLKRAL
jgi:hypothetical protein